MPASLASVSGASAAESASKRKAAAADRASLRSIAGASQFVGGVEVVAGGRFLSTVAQAALDARNAAAVEARKVASGVQGEAAAQKALVLAASAPARMEFESPPTM